VLWWLLDPARFRLTFDTILWPLVGVFFVPWTALMYVFVAPGGLSPVNWVFLGIALLVDLGSYGGGYRAKGKRSR